MRRVKRIAPIVAVAVSVAGWAARADEAAGVREQVTRASAAYAEAYNRRDFKALADQWIERAELVEGGSRVAGRDAIVGSIKGWLEKHGQASIRIDVQRIDLVAKTLARVDGLLVFTPAKGAAPIASRFSSLRVLEDGVWRLVESVVAPSPAAALADLGWLVGTWQAKDDKAGISVELTFEKAAGGSALIGRTTTRRQAGGVVEAVEVIHADLGKGTIRTSIVDSSGAHAEGVIEGDGLSLNRILVGVPGTEAQGRRVQWVQTVVPGGEGRFTLQSIERSLDGRPVPDAEPLHFTRR